MYYRALHLRSCFSQGLRALKRCNSYRAYNTVSGLQGSSTNQPTDRPIDKQDWTELHISRTWSFLPIRLWMISTDSSIINLCCKNSSNAKPVTGKLSASQTCLTTTQAAQSDFKQIVVGKCNRFDFAWYIYCLINQRDRKEPYLTNVKLSPNKAYGEL